MSKKNKKVPKMIRIDQTKVDEVEKLMEQDDRSFNYMINKFIEEALKKRNIKIKE